MNIITVGKSENIDRDEKLDSVQLEYLYLLQSQLASQKLHFEGIIDRLEQQHQQEVMDSVIEVNFKILLHSIVSCFQREEIKEKVKITLKENERLKAKEKKVRKILNR